MRQLLIQVPRGSGPRVLDFARDLEAANTTLLQAVGLDERPLDLVVTHLSNHKVETLLHQLEALEDVQISFFPQGVLALRPPSSEAPDQVTDVQRRSPVEVFLAGHQSVGSWTGFLGYAAAAAAVVWVGLFTGTIYLLTAAMLLAPFAGPAMNTAIATASGDPYLLRRSVLRYVAAIGLTVAVACALSLVMGQQEATAQMIERSQISSVALLLPLVAGVAGALFLTASDRSSLVSGAAVGLLVAASLAPPAGLVGMSLAIGRWDLAVSGTYVLVLQLVGINLSGALFFRLFGLSRGGARYRPGWPKLFPVGLVVTALLMAGLLVWQFSTPIQLQRSTEAQRIANTIMQEVTQSGLGEPLEVNARFARTSSEAPYTLLADVYVKRLPGTTASTDAVRRRLTQQLQELLQQQWPHVEPLLQVSVLEPPETPVVPASAHAGGDP